MLSVSREIIHPPLFTANTYTLYASNGTFSASNAVAFCPDATFANDGLSRGLRRIGLTPSPTETHSSQVLHLGGGRKNMTPTGSL